MDIDDYEDASGDELVEDEFEGKSKFKPPTISELLGEKKYESSEKPEINRNVFQAPKILNRKAQRKSNESLNNIRQTEEIAGTGSLAHELNPDFQWFFEQAMGETKAKREQFLNCRAEQIKLRPDQRTPHYIDEDGWTRPYTDEQIKEAAEKKAEFRRKREAMGADYNGQEITPVFDVLNLEPESAVPDPKLHETMGKFKDFVYFTQDFFGAQSGKMFDYQDLYMDEKDLAETDFRKQKRGISMQQFVEQKPDIYESFKEHQKAVENKKIRARQEQEEAE